MTPSGAGAPRTGKFPVDSTGALPDGRSFSGPPNELKTILKADRDAFAQGLTEKKLLTYGLGRGLELMTGGR